MYNASVIFLRIFEYVWIKTYTTSVSRAVDTSSVTCREYCSMSTARRGIPYFQAGILGEGWFTMIYITHICCDKRKHSFNTSWLWFHETILHFLYYKITSDIQGLTGFWNGQNACMYIHVQASWFSAILMLVVTREWGIQLTLQFCVLIMPLI